MSFKLKILFASSPLLFIGLINPCFATLGSFDYGYGAISKSLGGTGVAHPEDSFVSAINPAGLAFVDEEIDFNLAAFSPNRGYYATRNNLFFNVAPGNHTSRKPFFLVPGLGYVHHFCESHLTLGASLYANGGMNTDYKSNFTGASIGFGPGVYGGNAAGIDYRQLFINLGLAWKIQENFSIGLSLIPVIQSISLIGISPFNPFSVSPGFVSNQNTQYSYGLGTRIGIFYSPRSNIAFGVGYQPKIRTSRFTRYRGILAEHGSLNVPASGTVGMTFIPRCDLAFNGDIQHIWYSDVPAFHNRNICDPLSGQPCLGTNNGSAFGWHSTTAYKIGAELKATPSWIFRAGFVYTSDVIPNDQVLANIIAPAVTKAHYTFGFTHIFNRCLNLNTNFLYAPNVSLTGINTFNHTQRIRITMYQYEMGASLTWKLDS